MRLYFTLFFVQNQSIADRMLHVTCLYSHHLKHLTHRKYNFLSLQFEISVHNQGLQKSSSSKRMLSNP